MPLSRPQQLEQQKEFCGLIIASKDRLTKIFQEDLRGKDDEYVKALKKQADDIGAASLCALLSPASLTCCTPDRPTLPACPCFFPSSPQIAFSA